jgi:uncharacterized protein YciI
MNRNFLALIIGALLCATSLFPQSKAPDAAPAGLEIPKNMRPYFVVFLVAEPGAPKMSEDNELVKRHLAYIHEQAAAKKYVLAGPFTDSGRIRGILIISAETAEAAEAIVKGDPAAQGGLVKIEIHPAMLPEISDVMKY